MLYLPEHTDIVRKHTHHTHTHTHTLKKIAGIRDNSNREMSGWKTENRWEYIDGPQGRKS